MSVLELPAPQGALTLPRPSDLRGRVNAAVERFSSSDARPDDGRLGQDAPTELAAQLGSSERAFRTAYGMLRRHLAPAGVGEGTRLTATLVGMRRVRLRAAGLVVQGRTADFRVGVALIADPLVLLAIGGAEQVVHWSLLPGGPSVTARADGLRFLRALATGGQLVFEMGERVDFPPLDVDDHRWEYEDEWRLFEDLATLEEWSGVTIPMPEEASAEESTMAAQAASWARTQQIPARVADAITFTANDVLVEEPDELQLHQDFGIGLLGVEVPLGEGVVGLKLAQVERHGSLEQDRPQYRAQPAQPEITLQLHPPPNRRLPSHRTQPERVAAPRPEPLAEPRPRPQFVRRSRRTLADVLADRRGRHLLQRSPSTRRLLDDLRGT